MTTLPETNIFARENGWLEYDPFLLGRLGLFSGANMLVSGRVYTKSSILIGFSLKT